MLTSDPQGQGQSDEFGEAPDENEFSWIPNVAFPATLRGADAVAWYTTA